MCPDEEMNGEASKRSFLTAFLAGDHSDSQPQHAKLGNQKSHFCNNQQVLVQMSYFLSEIILFEL
jgi:hypothetical protein